MSAKNSKNVEQSVPTAASAGSPMTTEDVRKALESIARKVVESRTAHLHALLTLNDLLRQPNAQKIFSEDLRQQARDLWLKVKSAGFQLDDPPLLFGIPDSGDGVGNGGTKQSGPMSPLRM